MIRGTFPHNSCIYEEKTHMEVIAAIIIYSLCFTSVSCEQCVWSDECCDKL